VKWEEVKEQMSLYTDTAHEKALEQTLFWQATKPVSKEDFFVYAQYYFSLKDYQEAVIWYKKAAALYYIPAIYELAYCMRHELGCSSNAEEEAILFGRVLEANKTSDFSAYHMGMCFTYGYGTAVDEGKGFQYFRQAEHEVYEAMYELGLFYKMGKGNVRKDLAKATTFFRRAYEGGVEEAIFELYDSYDGELKDFPDQRDLKQAYAFKLGRLLRVAELKPCREYLQRVAKFYRAGFSGDTEESVQKFLRFAKEYEKKAEQFSNG